MNIDFLDLNDFDVIDIISTAPYGVLDTYDIEVDDINMFTAKNPDSGFESISHNSATLCLFSLDDDEMMTAKTGDWFVTNPQRGRSNNSVALLRSAVTKERFMEIMESVKQFGEPGFVFVDDLDILVNPCVEIGMVPKYLVETEEDSLELGAPIGTWLSGAQGCNLTEINGGLMTTRELFLDACKASAIIGTFQASYTDFKYVSAVSKKIFDKEALLGASITGWMNNPDVLFDEELLKEGVAVIKHYNEVVAKMIGINPAARLTCTKPAGTSCSTFDSVIKTSNGNMTLAEIFNYCSDDENFTQKLSDDKWYGVKKQLMVYDENATLQPITGLFCNGRQEVYEIEFEDGLVYKFTAEHRLKTHRGWVLVKDLREGDDIISIDESITNNPQYAPEFLPSSP